MLNIIRAFKSFEKVAVMYLDRVTSMQVESFRPINSGDRGKHGPRLLHSRREFHGNQVGYWSLVANYFIWLEKRILIDLLRHCPVFSVCLPYFVPAFLETGNFASLLFFKNTLLLSSFLGEDKCIALLS